MAKLTVESEQILIDKDQINALIAPNICDFFSFSQYLDNLILKPMSEINQKDIYKNLPIEVIELAKRYQLIETLVAKIEKPINEHLQKRLQKSEQPHINHGNELHIFLAGEGYFIFNLNNKKYRLDISAGDMLYIDGNTEHSFFLTENKHLMLASFHQDEFEVFHKRVEYK